MWIYSKNYNVALITWPITRTSERKDIVEKYITQRYSAVAGWWNPERKRHQKWEENAGNDQGVHVETNAASDRHGVRQLGELHRLGMTAWIALVVLPRRAVHQHPLVAFAEDGELEVFRAVDVQVQAPVVQRPGRQSHVASVADRE